MNIIICVAKFDPKKGVGARRWFYLAKSLSDRGISVTVFTGEACYETTQYFFKDAIERNFFNLKIVSGSNKSINATNNRLRKRIKALRSLLNKEIDTFENWAIRLRSDLIEFLNRKTADIIIASGHPCSLLYQVMSLKPLYNQILFVCDYRDLWNQEVNYSVSRLIFKSIKLKSLQQEYETLLFADLVTHVSEGQSLVTQKQFPNLLDKYQNKFKVINNFIINDNLKHINSNGDPENFNWLHFGNIRNESLDSFYKFIASLENQCSGNTKLHIFGVLPKHRNRLERESLSNNVVLKKVVGISDQKKILSSYKNAVVFFNKTTGYGTKIFDYIAADINFIVICDESELYDLCAYYEIPHISTSDLLNSGIPFPIKKMPSQKRKIFLEKFSNEVVSDILIDEFLSA